MPISIRLARQGEELAFAKLHYEAFSAPSESYRAFVSPRYAAFEEYTIATGEKRRYAGLIEKQSVCCAVFDRTKGKESSSESHLGAYLIAMILMEAFPRARLKLGRNLLKLVCSTYDDGTSSLESLPTAPTPNPAGLMDSRRDALVQDACAPFKEPE